ncbi:MAG: hypothetical protein AB7O47_01630 [Flavobacteriales bacterium]
MKKFLAILIVLFAVVRCKNKSTLDIELDTLKVENCQCLETIYEATIECYEFELKGWEIREKECLKYVKGYNFGESTKYFNTVVNPSYKRLDEIIKHCTKIGMDETIFTCYENLISTKQEQDNLYHIMVGKRIKVNELAKKTLDRD